MLDRDALPPTSGLSSGARDTVRADLIRHAQTTLHFLRIASPAGHPHRVEDCFGVVLRISAFNVAYPDRAISREETLA